MSSAFRYINFCDDENIRQSISVTTIPPAEVHGRGWEGLVWDGGKLTL